MDPLIRLALATFAFVGTHLALSHPLRAPLVRRLGERRFDTFYSVVALMTFGAIIFAYWETDAGTPLWVAPPWAWWTVSAVMLLAGILLAGSLVRNPAFPHPGAEPKAIPPARGVFAITRHPMNWSFLLWAASHIALIGTVRNLIVAGGILLLALLGSIGQDAKKARLLGEHWRDWQARTSFIPFGALLAGKVRPRDAVPGPVALIGGLVLWTLITWFHAPAWSPLALIGHIR